jgi:chemotaxis-related protein WspD
MNDASSVHAAHHPTPPPTAPGGPPPRSLEQIDAQLPPVTAPADREECWRRIGVTGDRSCRELETYIHCRNCPVMADAARAFFDRLAPIGYLESWSGILEERGARRDLEVVSVLVFRLAEEWLALPTTVLVEVTKERRCHRVPHRTNGVLDGLVNIRGQLQLCVSVQRLLGIEGTAPGQKLPPADSIRIDDPDLRRLLVVERPGRHGPDRWVFPVDQVAGVIRVAQATLRAVPATVSQSGARFCQALFDWQGVMVGILDETRLLDGLNDRVRST